MNVYRCILITAFIILTHTLFAQQSAIITIDVSKKEAPVSPTLHGIFFEEISHAGEGGLYGELIQNRGFEEANIPPGMKLVNDFIVPPQTPGFTTPKHAVSDWKMEWPVKTDFPAWSYKANGSEALQVSRTDIKPLNNATSHSMQIDISSADSNNSIQIINEGFWGINVVKGDSYKLNFYLRSNHYKGKVTVMLQSEDGSVLAAYAFSSATNNDWKKYSATLTAVQSNTKAKFILSFNNTGTVWLDYVSLFPSKTFMNRTNGLRKDLAQYIADLHPAFIRWPGGCFVEGITIQSAPDWKQTIGPVEKRVETYSPWGYYTSNGFGYHEYLQFCEDIGASALYVFNAGVSCEYRSGTYVTDDSLRPYIQSALDAIEYAIGPVTSKWGKVRAANGHPKLFPLKYAEVGNEQSGPNYAERYNIFYDAIKAKYPSIEIMASMGIGDVNTYTTKQMQHIDYVDEHAYKAAGWVFTHFNHFDKYPRDKWKMYVGEYATNGGVGAGNMEASLSDAVYIMAMEKNSDLVKMSSYAPLLVNVNDIDWPVNLINFDASKSFARISYYAIKMMNENRPDVNVATTLHIIPPAIKTPAFTGGIGLATWDTQTEYKDIELTHNDTVVYKSDFIKKPGEWQLVRGKWAAIADSGLAQTAEGAQRLAILKDKIFSTYTLKLKARKLDGYNAFIIPFAVKDTNTFLRIHIGSYVNQNTVYESVTNGYDVADISSQKKLTSPIVKGKWYDIKIEVGIDTVKTYLNDRLISFYTEPAKLFSIAGKDEKKGDIIIKVVNASPEAIESNIKLNGLPMIKSDGTLTTLSAKSGDEENSFATPEKTIPVTENISGVSADFKRVFPAFSISVIRIKTQ